MNNLSELLLEAAELLSEGAVKTSKKYKLDNYLKKHNYDKETGTIEINGRKIKIDKDIKSKTFTTSDGHIARRQTFADMTSPEGKIILDKNFEQLKNNKRRDAILNHEVGHIKYHNISSPETTKKSRDAALDGMAKTQLLANGLPVNNMNKALAKSSMSKEYPAKSKKFYQYNKTDRERHKNLKKLKNYEKDNIEHSDRTEFEADIYASQQKNGDQLKRGLRESYKHFTKNTEKELSSSPIKFIRDSSNAVKKQINIAAQNDMKQRTKALKDKSVNRQVYRESVEILLCEAIELLDM